MAVVGKLSAKRVETVSAKGRYNDGGGLYLAVGEGNSKSWVFRYALRGRKRYMGLGPVHTISLAKAREKARQYRELLLEGIDPMEHRRGVIDVALLEAATVMTFKECALAYIGAHEAAWKNQKHVQQWKNTLTTYAYPVIGNLPVQGVDTGLVMKVLEPIWVSKSETASRVRGRIEVILDWAKVRAYRMGENPARWKGHLNTLLPSKSKVRRVRHHAALPYNQLGAFMVELRKREGFGALGLELTILTAARTGEIINATWDEIDLDNKLWIIAAERMKAGKKHRVPLSIPALAVLDKLLIARMSDFILPGKTKVHSISNMAFLQTLKRMKRPDLTTHGFRSTFRDWAAERTAYPHEVAEMALAHTVGNKVEAAYRRGDMFEKRQRIMEDWAAYCGTISKDNNVVAIREQKG
jgi:integrase